MGAADSRRRHPPKARLRVRRFVTVVAIGAAIVGAAIVGAAFAATAAARAAETQASGADLVEQGRDLYGDMCATCHGRDMVNAGGIAFDLRKFPNDDFARFRNSVLNGKNQAMPPWRDTLGDDDIAALWAYVRSGG